MAIRRAEFDEDFHRWPTRDDWIAWARRMGLDPDVIPLPGWIEADDEARTVRTEYHVRSPNGDGFLLDASGGRLQRLQVTVQLESPAQAMPRVYA